MCIMPSVFQNFNKDNYQILSLLSVKTSIPRASRDNYYFLGANPNWKKNLQPPDSDLLITVLEEEKRV